MSKEETPKRCNCSCVKKQLIKYHMIIMILAAVIIGVIFPAPGNYMAKTPFAKICIMCIFFISGLKLNMEQIKKALHAWPAALSSTIFILFLTPIFGWILLFIPMTPQELIIGLACVTCAPTTMASGAILTEQCGGNFGCGLLLSVATNMLGIVVVPFTVSLMFNASGVSIELDAVGMLLELLYQIAVPMVVGYLLSTYVCGVAAFVKKYNTMLKFLSSFFLCLVPWQKVSASAEELLSLNVTEFFELLGLALALNITFFATSLFMAWVFRFSLEDIKAVTLCCTGKTLPIALTIVSYLPESMGDQGLLTLPCLVIQFLQLITTSIISGVFSGIGTHDKTAKKQSRIIAPVMSPMGTIEEAELKTIKATEISIPGETQVETPTKNSETNSLSQKSDISDEDNEKHEDYKKENEIHQESTHVENMNSIDTNISIPDINEIQSLNDNKSSTDKS